MTTVEALTASKNTLTAIQQMEDVMKASDKLLEGQDTPLMEAREVSIVMEMLHNRARRYQTVASAGMWGLSMREQCVLHSYYLCGKTIREIGEAFGLRERMVKQIKSDALAKLAQKEGVNDGDNDEVHLRSVRQGTGKGGGEGLHHMAGSLTDTCGEGTLSGVF